MTKCNFTTTTELPKNMSIKEFSVWMGRGVKLLTI